MLTYEENAAALSEAAGKAPIRTVERFLRPGGGRGIAGEDPPGRTPRPSCSTPAGTTGLKKGVVITWGQLEAQVVSYAKALEFGPEDKVASWLPLYHDMGLITGFLMPVSLGAMVISLDPFEWVARPAMLLKAIETYGATLCWLPNFAFAHLVRTAEEGKAHDLSSMRAFVNCSEPCKAETFEGFLERFPAGVAAGQLQTCYAMAESVFAVTQSRLGEAPRVLEIDAGRYEASQEIFEAAEGSTRGGTG